MPRLDIDSPAVQEKLSEGFMLLECDREEELISPNAVHALMASAWAHHCDNPYCARIHLIHDVSWPEVRRVIKWADAQNV
jgi:hypothetical protein